MLNKIKIQPFTKVQYYKNNIYPSIPFEDTDLYIITNQSDRLDILSQQYYGTSEYWWVIATINNNITKGSIFPTPGTQLRIPQDINKVLRIFNNAN